MSGRAQRSSFNIQFVRKAKQSKTAKRLQPAGMYQHHSRLGFLNVFLDRDRASTATGRPRKCRKPYAPAGRRGCADTTGKNHNLKRDVKHKFLGMMVYIINELAGPD